MIDTPYEPVYFLSDIEKMMQNDYDLNTDNLYQWIMDTLFVEGRYWERVWGFELSLTNFREQRAPENVEHIINLIKQDLELDKDVSNYDKGAQVISIYVDYKKDVNID